MIKNYQQNTSIAYREIDGEAVLIEPGTGTVFVFNKVGSRVWALIDEPRPLEWVVGEVAAGYRQGEERVGPDVSGFLEVLVDRGLVEER